MCSNGAHCISRVFGRRYLLQAGEAVLCPRFDPKLIQEFPQTHHNSFTMADLVTADDTNSPLRLRDPPERPYTPHPQLGIAKGDGGHV